MTPIKFFLLLFTAIFLVVLIGGVVQWKYNKADIAMSNVSHQTDTPILTEDTQTETRAGTARPSGFVSLMYLSLSLLALTALILMPFLPGMAEVIRSEDEKALALNMNFTKDYKYFGDSFHEILERGLSTQRVTEPGEYSLVLSKPEKVRVIESERVSDNTTIDQILYVLADLASGSSVQFNREIYVKGMCAIGDRNALRALYCESDIVISEGTAVARWVNGNRDIEIKEDCRLGISVATHQRLALARNCSFRRMFGLPISSYKTLRPNVPPNEKAKDISNSTVVITKREIVIPPQTQIERNIVTHRKIVLKGKCFVKADIKSYSDIIIESGSWIVGNLISERNVIIEPECFILGNVFSQGYVQLGNAVQVGQEGQIKSIIAKKGVTVESNVDIYGYIMTEGKGHIS